MLLEFMVLYLLYSLNDNCECLNIRKVKKKTSRLLDGAKNSYPLYKFVKEKKKKNQGWRKGISISIYVSYYLSFSLSYYNNIEF